MIIAVMSWQVNSNVSLFVPISIHYTLVHSFYQSQKCIVYISKSNRKAKEMGYPSITQNQYMYSIKLTKNKGAVPFLKVKIFHGFEVQDSFKLLFV